MPALCSRPVSELSLWHGAACVAQASLRPIVGWRVSRTHHAGFVLDALGQDLFEPWPALGKRILNHGSSRLNSPLPTVGEFVGEVCE